MTSSYERFAVAAPVAALLLGAACGDGGSGTSPSVIAEDAATDAHVDASADVDSPTSKQDAGAAPWNVTPTPTFSGQYSAVGDPSVLHAADGSYLMYHHCLDVEHTPQGVEPEKEDLFFSRVLPLATA